MLCVEVRRILDLKRAAMVLRKFKLGYGPQKMTTAMRNWIAICCCAGVITVLGIPMLQSLTRRRAFTIKIKNDLRSEFYISIDGHSCAGTVKPNKFLPCEPSVYLPGNRYIKLSDKSTGVTYRSDLRFVEVASQRTGNYSEPVLVLMSDIVESVNRLPLK